MPVASSSCGNLEEIYSKFLGAPEDGSRLSRGVFLQQRFFKFCESELEQG